MNTWFIGGMVKLFICLDLLFLPFLLYGLVVGISRGTEYLKQIMHDINCIREDMDEFVDRKNKDKE